MLPALDLYFEHVTTFALVLARIAALVIVAPVFGTFALPARARVLLALALAVLVVPLEAAREVVPPSTLGDFLVAAGGELLVGMTLGLGVRILFAGMHVAGQIISQMSGLQLAEVYSAGSGEGVPALSQLFLVVTSAVFLAIGGHRLVIEALLDSYARLPAGQGGFSRSAVEAVTTLLAQSFVLGVRAAAPAMVALLSATLIVGIVSRTLPQPGVVALGLSVNVLVALVAAGISLGGACWIFQDQLRPALATAMQAIGAV